jgi:heptosyltransferase III
LKTIILSRTDSIGDVILTLPMAGVLKKYLPGCRIIFLGKSYTKPVIEASENIDLFLDWDEIQMPDAGYRIKDLTADVIIHVFPDRQICKLAKKAGIPVRIATSHRWFTGFYCNDLLHFSRMNSGLHEAQLNLKMLAPLGVTDEFPLAEIPDYYGLTKLASGFRPQASGLPFPTPSPSPKREGSKSNLVSGIRHPASGIQHPASASFNLILHPKSKGSAREWGLDNYSKLIDLLPQEKFKIFITGTVEDGLLMKDFLEKNKEKVTDLTGKLTLAELIAFINSCDGLVAASTGPLHIAAALGKHVLGLYAPMKPIYPKRWAPLGKYADYLVFDKEGCTDCKRSADCTCIRSIKPEEVVTKLVNW